MEAPLFLHVFASLLVLDHMVLSETKQVVIVGGGVSGLAAASHLCDNGMCDITILEAGDRLGGRLRSDRFQGALIQRGAQYIHGETDNPIYDVLSKNFNLTTPIYYDRAATSFYRISGQPINDETVKKYRITTDEVWTQLTRNLSKENEYLFIDKNIGDETVRIWTEEVGSTLSGVDRNLTDAMLNHLLSYWSIESGDITTKVGMLVNLYFKDSGDDYLVDGDYADALIGILKKSIPDYTVKLQQRVMRIDWNVSTSEQNHCAFKSDASNDGGAMVRVQYTDVNTGEMDEICADHVIVTVSIGVLQKHYMAMFNPEFTDEKSRALESLRMGIVNKVLLHFEHCFWAHKVMLILWDCDLCEEFGDDAVWFRHIYYIADYGNNILLFWLNSFASQTISQFTDDEIGRKLTFLLKKVLRNDSISFPNDVLVTAWHEDENFLGSYSYIPVGETLENKAIVAAPLSVGGVPKVLFAGEGMHHSRFSTVDGAYRTGINEAKRLLDFVHGNHVP